MDDKEYVWIVRGRLGPNELFTVAKTEDEAITTSTEMLKQGYEVLILKTPLI